MSESFRGQNTSHGWTHLECLAVALTATVAVHHGALATFFARDDLVYLERAAGLASIPSWSRPLSTIVGFALEYALFRLRPLGYHALDLLLHLLNVIGVYALTVRLLGTRTAACVAAALFGMSSIAFTPLHWATGIIELSTCTLLLIATLIHLEGPRRGDVWYWAAALIGFAAMLCKETAVAWVLLVVFREWANRPRRSARAIVPALLAGSVFILWFASSGKAGGADTAGPYSLTIAPAHLTQNMVTYLGWCVSILDPIPDRVAASSVDAWGVGVTVGLGVAVVFWLARRHSLRGARFGVSWFGLLLLPVLPLTHHTYLYYLYIPWVGAVVAVAAVGIALVHHIPRSMRVGTTLSLLALYAVAEGRNATLRETQTQDGLPIDPIMRDEMLLRHSIPALVDERLPSGTEVGFVNPAPRQRFDLTTGEPTRAEDMEHRTARYALEVALQDGRALRLFTPHLVYRGFATRIPPEWDGVQCFYFDQRGWLKRWGVGRRALMEQGAILLEAGQSAAAESTFRRARALADTMSGTPTGVARAAP